MTSGGRGYSSSKNGDMKTSRAGAVSEAELRTKPELEQYLVSFS